MLNVTGWYDDFDNGNYINGYIFGFYVSRWGNGNLWIIGLYVKGIKFGEFNFNEMDESLDIHSSGFYLNDKRI